MFRNSTVGSMFAGSAIVLAVATLSPRAAGQTFVDVNVNVDSGRHGGEVDFEVFYDGLSPHGDWFQLPSYGWVWTPRQVEVDWRPYTHGRWIYTDYGWTWESKHEWGWAPFHYGRWFFEPRYGWVWVPGTEWAPAWVTWRRGSDFVGWAPLPPEARYSNLSIDFGGFSVETVIAEHAWSFVEPRYILEPDIRHRCVVPARNITLVRSTQPVTRHVSVEGRIGDFSIDIDFVERYVGRPVQRVRVIDVDPGVRDRRSYVRDNDFYAYRPRIRKANVNTQPRVIGSPKRVVGVDDNPDWYRARERELESRREEDRRTLVRDQEREWNERGRGPDADNIRRRQAQEKEALDRQYKIKKSVIEQKNERQMEEKKERRSEPEGRGGSRTKKAKAKD